MKAVSSESIGMSKVNVQFLKKEIYHAPWNAILTYLRETLSKNAQIPFRSALNLDPL